MSKQVTKPEVHLDVLHRLAELASHTIPAHARNPLYFLGGFTFLALIIQVLTGTLLAFYYQPTPESAYNSVKFLMNEVRFGGMVRSLHFYGANLMIIFVVLHMLRVFYTGAFKPPRHKNWLVGVTLLILTLGFGFTGYLLPWDQMAYWATKVGTETMAGVPYFGKYLMIGARGGLKITSYTLTRFYIVHVMLLPILTIGLVLVHFLLMRVYGMSERLEQR